MVEIVQAVEPPKWASGVNGIHGLSGAGKSSLADTAAEYVAERFGLRTLCIANDPGGWGSRRLSLIRAGVMSVYDPSNHVDFFDTMEKLTKGAFPAEILDADRGYADPHVKLVMPRTQQWLRRCPQGHDVKVYDDQHLMVASSDACPTCGVVVTVANQLTEQRTVRPALFKRVGLRIFDSMTGMSDRGLLIELTTMSAKGEVGGVLSGADAIRQGDFVAGTGSKAQVGFMQNRMYGWLLNIRAIPDQVVGAICTFGVEQSGGDDSRGGGEICYGPALAGTARTARAAGWVGNLLHATKEPDEQGRARHRLWLTNHIDPRDAYKRPYLAKHRGTPDGMPDYLEDPWSDDPAERAKAAWSVCSMGYFFRLLEAQFERLQAADQAKYAAFKTMSAVESEDDVVSVAQTAAPVAVPVTVGSGGRRSLSPAMPAAAVVPAASAPVSVPAPSAPVVSSLRRPGAVPQPQVVNTGHSLTAPQAASTTAMRITGKPDLLPAVEAPSPIVQQLTASLAERVVQAAVEMPFPAPAANDGAGASPVNASVGTPSVDRSVAPAADVPAVVGPPVAPVPSVAAATATDTGSTSVAPTSTQSPAGLRRPRQARPPV